MPWITQNTQKGGRAMSAVCTIGLDLAKQFFQVHGVDYRGHVVIQKKLTRQKLLRFFAKLPQCVVGMEDCGKAHHWERELEKLGHAPKLMPTQYVKPYVKTNKNDRADAEAICEAVTRPSMRFVAVKSVEQQEVLVLHRIRQSLTKRRTALVNETRGLLLEFGIALQQGIENARESLPRLVEDLHNELTLIQRNTFSDLYNELAEIDERIVKLERQLKVFADTLGVMSAATQGAWPRHTDCYRIVSHCGKSNLIQKRLRASCMAGHSAKTALIRRQGSASRHQQTRRRLSSLTIDPRSQSGTSVLLSCVRQVLQIHPRHDG
jgi:hypothetical protein